MKVLTNTALVALLVASMGVSGLTPSFAAPDKGAAQSGMTHRHMGPHHPGMRGHRGPGFGAMLLTFGCSPRAGEGLEIAFVRAKYDLQLDATQQPMLDTLRTAALADQLNIAAACKAGRVDTAGTPHTLLDRLQASLSIAKAKAAALDDIVPKFKTFYDGLNADQQKRLDTHTSWRGRGFGGPHHGMQPGGMSPGAMPPPDGTTPTPGAAPDKAAVPSST